METIIKETYGWRETKKCKGCGDILIEGKCPSCGIQREEFVKIYEERTHRYSNSYSYAKQPVSYKSTTVVEVKKKYRKTVAICVLAYFGFILSILGGLAKGSTIKKATNPDSQIADTAWTCEVCGYRGVGENTEHEHFVYEDYYDWGDAK